MTAKDKSASTPGGRTITIEVNADGEALYDVQEIRKMRLTVDGDAEFLVKWKGYKTPTWEPLSNLDSSSPMMVAFMRKETASGKKPRVFTPRKSIGPATPLKTAGSAKNTPTKPSTPNRSVRLVQLKTIDTRAREAALARARREQAEEEEKEEEKEKEENAPAEQIRVQKRPRLLDDVEEIRVVKIPRQDHQIPVEKKVEEKKGRCSVM